MQYSTEESGGYGGYSRYMLFVAITNYKKSLVDAGTAVKNIYF